MDPKLYIQVSTEHHVKEHLRQKQQIISLIVNLVILCAYQKITMSGNKDDKIDFLEPPTSNEGNWFKKVGKKNMSHSVKPNTKSNLVNHLNCLGLGCNS